MEDNMEGVSGPRNVNWGGGAVVLGVSVMPLENYPTPPASNPASANRANQ